MQTGAAGWTAWARSKVTETEEYALLLKSKTQITPSRNIQSSFPQSSQLPRPLSDLLRENNRCLQCQSNMPIAVYLLGNSLIDKLISV